MKKQCIIIGALAFFSAFNIVNGQEKDDNEKERVEELDEIVIDSRFKIKKENSGKIVHKITSKTIEQNKGKTVVDLINRIAGIEINGNTSVFGQTLGYFVRGGRSNEVVILIDGLQVVNPLQNNFDLRLLNLEQVESIEISKGASSTLYGSGAATAVIDIRMKKAKSGVSNSYFGTSLGSNKTATKSNKGTVKQVDLGTNGTIKKLNYLASFSLFESDGFSAAKDMAGTNNFNDDPFRRNNFDLRLGYDFSDSFSTTATYSVNNFNNSYDAGSFADGNNQARESNYRFSFSPEYRYASGSVKVNFGYTKFDIDRTNTSFPGKSNGDNTMVDAFVKHNFKKVKLIVGVNLQKNKIQTFSIPFGQTQLTETQYSQKPETTITDPYANIVFISGSGFNANAGVRLNNHSIYGNHFVYNLNPSYRFTNENGYARFFGSYSTAFVAPSIQELFATWGNPDLKPQESSSYEFGAEYKLGDFLVNAVYFNRDVKNIIVFDSTTFRMTNGGDTTINGVEINTSYQFTKEFAVNANYSYTKNDVVAIRIPKNKFNANFTYILSEKTNFSLDYQYVSDRDDTDFRNFSNPLAVQLASYSLLDFGVKHSLSKQVDVYGNITNILNEDYQEIFGFSTRGRNFQLGMRLQF